MEKSTRRVKFRRTTQEQLDFYMDFCRRHPQFLGGKDTSCSPAELQKLWRILADNLNSLKGPVRTPVKWKESLAVWKSQLRARARKKGETKAYSAQQSSRYEFEQLALNTFGSIGIRSSKPSTRLAQRKKTDIKDNELFPAPDENLPCIPSIKSDKSSRPSSPEYIGLEPKMSEANSQRSRSSSPMSVKAHELSREDLLNIILRSIEQRDARELQIIEAQFATAKALESIGIALSNLSNAIKELHK